MTITRTGLAALLRGSPVQAAEEILAIRDATDARLEDLEDSPGAAAAAPIIEERIDLVGYTSSQLTPLSDPIAAGAPLNVSTPTLGVYFGFARYVPRLVVGDDPADVVADSENGALAPSTVTLTGTDCTGEVLVRSVNVTAKGDYSFGRAFASYTSLTSDVDVGAPVQLFIGKGFGLLNPIDTETAVSVSIDDGASVDASPTVDGPTGTVIPAGTYNNGEGPARVRYRPSTG